MDLKRTRWECVGWTGARAVYSTIFIGSIGRGIFLVYHSERKLVE
jgi:hypothetical protein